MSCETSFGLAWPSYDISFLLFCMWSTMSALFSVGSCLHKGTPLTAYSVLLSFNWAFFLLQSYYFLRIFVHLVLTSSGSDGWQEYQYVFSHMMESGGLMLYWKYGLKLVIGTVCERQEEKPDSSFYQFVCFQVLSFLPLALLVVLLVPVLWTHLFVGFLLVLAAALLCFGVSWLIKQFAARLASTSVLGYVIAVIILLCGNFGFPMLVQTAMHYATLLYRGGFIRRCASPRMDVARQSLLLATIRETSFPQRLIFATWM